MTVSYQVIPDVPVARQDKMVTEQQGNVTGLSVFFLLSTMFQEENIIFLSEMC